MKERERERPAGCTLCKSQSGTVKRRRKCEVAAPSLILIPGNSHKFVPWPVSTRRRFPSYLFYARHCRRKMGHRPALERELARSLARSLVRPYPVARSRTYCANVWHSRYVRRPLPLPRRTHVAHVDIRMCSPGAMCTGWKRRALCYENGELRYRVFSFAPLPSPLPLPPSPWSLWLSLTLYV